jgi:hypothetical protein
MHEYEKKQMNDPAQIREFALAGLAYLTLVSVKTQVRFTYEVKNTPEPEPGQKPSPVSHFVGLLTRPDGEFPYQYLGHIFEPRDGGDIGNYRHGKKAKIDETAPSAMAFKWFFEKVIVDGKTPEAIGLEVWHEGRCGKCGRRLTVPESIARGIGPECYRRSHA